MVPRQPSILLACLACLACLLAACQDEGGQGEGKWAAPQKEVPLPASKGSRYSPSMTGSPDSSVLALWARTRYEDSGRSEVALARIGPSGEREEEVLYVATERADIFATFADAYPAGKGFVAGWIEKGTRNSLKVLAEAPSLGRTGLIDVTPPGARFIRAAAVLALPDFGFAVACAFVDSASSGATLWVGRFDASGRPAGAGPAFFLRPPGIGEIFTAALIRRPGGGWMVVWKEAPYDGQTRIAAQYFGQDDAASGPVRRWTPPACFHQANATLHAYPYPEDRVLFLSGGFEPSCGAVASWSGDGLAQFGAAIGYYEDIRFAAIDSSKGWYLAQSPGYFRLHDSTMAEVGVWKIPADSAIHAFCVPASGWPALLTDGPGDAYQVLFFEPFWR